MLQNPLAIKMARLLDNSFTIASDKIRVYSEQFVPNPYWRRVSEIKISFCGLLWVDSGADFFLSPPRSERSPPKTHSIDESRRPWPLYRAHIGVEQHLETAEAAGRLPNASDWLFLFVGDGSEKRRLQE